MRNPAWWSVYRPDREVLAGDNAVEVDEGHVLLHGQSQSDIVAVGRVRPSIPIPQKAVVIDHIVVGPIASFDGWHRRD